MEGIDPFGIGRGPQGVDPVVGAGFEGVDGAAVFVVAQSPQQHDSGKREGGCNPATGTAVACTDFLVDQAEQRRNDQSQNQEGEHDWLDDEDDVPRIPLLGEGPEGAYAVVVGEVQQDVAEPGQTGVEEEQAPAGGQIGIFDFAAAEAPQQIHETDYKERVKGNPEE